MLVLELKEESWAWSENMLKRFQAAAADPTVALEGEELNIFTSLSDWGWWDMCPLNDPDKEMFTKIHLAIRKYAAMKWAKEHPSKEERKLTKWEIVTGKRK